MVPLVTQKKEALAQTASVRAVLHADKHDW